MAKRTEIRDNRSRDWFYLDNELLEVFGGKGKSDRGIGVHALGVYMVLAKHANNETQQSKPSYQTIANLLGVSRNTVIAAIKTLEKAGLISVEQRTISEDKKVYTTNIYTLKNIKATEPIPADEPPGISDALPSARDGLGVVQEMDYPSAPEGPELDLSDKTYLDKTISVVVVASPPPDKKQAATTTTRPGKSEAVLIEEYFLLATTGSTGFMSAKQREICKDLEKQGMTAERARPGIDHTIAEMNGKGLSVGSISLCVAAIHQFDPARAKPVSIQNYQKPIPFEQPKREFREDDQRLTPLQQQLHDQKLAAYRREKAEEEQRRLQRIAQKQNLTAQVAVLQA
jgi:DNA-binding Lrp family transcriptional regulator